MYAIYLTIFLHSHSVCNIFYHIFAVTMYAIYFTILLQSQCMQYILPYFCSHNVCNIFYHILQSQCMQYILPYFCTATVYAISLTTFLLSHSVCKYFFVSSSASVLSLLSKTVSFLIVFDITQGLKNHL